MSSRFYLLSHMYAVLVLKELLFLKLKNNYLMTVTVCAFLVFGMGVDMYIRSEQ
jgi:hypothetical protein